MNTDILFFFNDHMDALPLYERLEGLILEQIPDVKIKVSKTQISFSDKRGFAFVYRSADLKKWERVGELCSKDDPLEDMWECPNLIHFPDGTATLLVSLMKAQGVFAMDGKYHDQLIK